MKKLSLLLSLFIIKITVIVAQDVKELILPAQYQITGVGELTYPSGIGTSSNGILSVVVEDQNDRKIKSAFFAYDAKTNASDGILVSADKGNLEIVKQFYLSANEWLFFANIRNEDSTTFAAHFIFNTLTGRFTSVVYYMPDVNRNRIFEIIDVAVQRADYYLLAKTVVLNNRIEKNKMVVAKVNNGKTVWSKSLNTTAPIHGEIPESLHLLFNGNVLVCGQSLNYTTNHQRAMFALIDGNGNILKNQEMYFYDPARRYERKSIWSKGALNGRRLHWFQQSIDSLAKAPQFVAMMMDTAGILSTWRNYDFPFMADDAIVANNAFLIGGGSLALSQTDAFTMIRINAQNAIPEGLFHNFPGKVQPESKGHSSLNFNAANNSFESLFYAKGRTLNRLLHFVGDARGLTACADSFRHVVARDPIEFRDAPFTFNNFEIFQSNENLNIEKISMRASVVCSPTNTDEQENFNALYLYQQNHQYLIVKNVDEGSYFINDIKGVKMSQGQITNDFAIDLDNLHTGLYFFTYFDKNNNSKIIPFIWR